MKKLLYVTGILILLAGCSTTEQATERDSPEERPIFNIDGEMAEEYLLEEMNETERMLFENRSELTDQFASVDHDMPEVFLKEVVREEQAVDEYAGYRVQLLTTRQVAVADSTKDEFRVWAATHIAGYEPEAYVIFRQPYYRVRAGNFRNQARAVDFSKLLKDKFPNAWVVHDRIEPSNVPADTTTIEMKQNVQFDSYND